MTNETDREPSVEGLTVNQDEAYELACLKRGTSNLARCYLELRERLASKSAAEELPPAPVAHVNMRTKAGCGDGLTWTGWALPHGAPLYAVPPTAVLLEVMEALKKVARVRGVGLEYDLDALDIAIEASRAVLPKLREWMGEKR